MCFIQTHLGVETVLGGVLGQDALVVGLGVRGVPRTTPVRTSPGQVLVGRTKLVNDHHVPLPQLVVLLHRVQVVDLGQVRVVVVGRGFPTFPTERSMGKVCDKV